MTPALSIRGLALSRGDRRVLDGIDLDVASGEIAVVMGASGAGKSTILRCIAALEPFSAGSISVSDAVLHDGAIPPQSLLTSLRQRVAMVFQNHALFEHLSALDNVMLAPVHVLGWTPERARAAAISLFDELGISARASAWPRQLSGGEAQRVAIARALIGNPSLLLLDEPTAALDLARRGVLASTLRGLAREGRAMLIVTHDAELAKAVADRTMVLVNGTIART